MHWHETEGRLGFMVRRMICDFLKPARIDDLLEVETRFREMAGARMELEQKVVRHGEMLFAAEVTVALVDASGRPKRFPKAMVQALKTF
jgi:acyl-CoA thioester hydrolase